MVLRAAVLSTQPERRAGDRPHSPSGEASTVSRPVPDRPLTRQSPPPPPAIPLDRLRAERDAPAGGQRGSSLRTPLLRGLAGALVLLGASGVGANFWLLRSGVEARTQSQAAAVAAKLSEHLDGGDRLQTAIDAYSALPDIESATVLQYGTDRKLVVVAHRDRALIGRSYTQLTPLWRDALAEVRHSSGRSVRIREKGVFARIVSLSRKGTKLPAGVAIVAFDRAAIAAPLWWRFWLASGLWCALAIAVWFAARRTLNRRVVSPLDRLQAAVARSQKTGNFNRPERAAAREIAALADAFERAIQRRSLLESALRDREARERVKSERLGQILKKLRQTQAHLIQSEKMSGLRQMVAGIAHELNNPVNFMRGNIEPIRQYAEDLLNLVKLYQQVCPHVSPDLEEVIDEMDLDFLMEDMEKILLSLQSGSDRVRDIVLSLRTFARLDEADMKAVDIRESLDSTLLVLNHRLETGRGIRLVQHYEPLPPVECHAGQMNQVFLNSIGNAIDALESGDRPVEGDPPTIWIEARPLGDRHVCIIIRDNGPGIPPEIQPRIFDPFFTTKPVGKGTGLGLSVSYQIVVERHGGKLTFNSQPGRGTEFRICIPIRSKG